MPKAKQGKDPETVETPDPEEENSEDAKIKWEGLKTGTESLTETEPNEQETLKAKLAELETRLSDYESLRENYKNLQRKYNKKFVESKPPSPPLGGQSDNTLELMLQMAKSRTDEMGNPVQDPMIPILQAEISKRQALAEQQRQLAYQEQVVAEERLKLEDRILEAGLTPDGEEFDAVWDAFRLAKLDGDFSSTHRKLDRVLKKVKATGGEPAPPEKKQSEETLEQIEARVRKQIMEERGELDVETGQPSRSSQSLLEKEKAFIEGKLPIEKLPDELKAKYR